jgi:3'-5' exonuclease
MVNNIAIPKILNTQDLKPWEVPHYDTMEMWRFGDKKAYTSLELLAATLDVTTSKSDIDGSQVNHTYYKLHDLQRIAEYCKRDVSTLANIYLRLNQLPTIPTENIL